MPLLWFKIAEEEYGTARTAIPSQTVVDITDTDHLEPPETGSKHILGH